MSFYYFLFVCLFMSFSVAVYHQLHLTCSSALFCTTLFIEQFRNRSKLNWLVHISFLCSRSGHKLQNLFIHIETELVHVFLFVMWFEASFLECLPHRNGHITVGVFILRMGFCSKGFCSKLLSNWKFRGCSFVLSVHSLEQSNICT